MFKLFSQLCAPKSNKLCPQLPQLLPPVQLVTDCISGLSVKTDAARWRYRLLIVDVPSAPSNK